MLTEYIGPPPCFLDKFNCETLYRQNVIFLENCVLLLFAWKFPFSHKEGIHFVVRDNQVLVLRQLREIKGKTTAIIILA